MESFDTLTAIAVPLMRINIDTDQIIPTRFLLRTTTAGLDAGLFADWRLLPDGSPNADFILNREPWRHAKIMLADRNFGCGSSREEAPRALRQAGFRVVIAPSFGEIFFGNCFRNGLLPVTLDIDALMLIAEQLEASGGHAQVAVDLAAGQVTAPGGQTFSFSTPALLRQMLLDGLDEIDLTAQLAGEIAAFRSKDAQRRPWAYPRAGGTGREPAAQAAS
jgi:3-isopropylmalate/(R)-2-methylmalate dehydratase small subunit